MGRKNKESGEDQKSKTVRTLINIPKNMN